MIAAAVDLGSTRIKAATLTDTGQLANLHVVEAPPLSGANGIREGNAEAYRAAADTVLAETLEGRGEGISLGFSTQRSSFVLWDKETGKAVAPFISWQDRRAESWCRARKKQGDRITGKTGLPLSPHYAGPKLAAVLEAAPSLRDRAEAGELLFGTLETFVLWHGSPDRRHVTDLSMAARTLLVELGRDAWSEELLAYFGLPRVLFPEIIPSTQASVPLRRGAECQALVSDQAAAALSLSELHGDTVLVNAGTGGFVLRPTGTDVRVVPGYLTAPLYMTPDRSTNFALEATVNGLVSALRSVSQNDGPAGAASADPADVFCLPDTAGIGSPYWLAEMPAVLTHSRDRLAPEDLRRTVFEGIAFRFRQCVTALGPEGLPEIVFLSGGLSGIPDLGKILANCLGRPVRILEERQASLLGAARLASGHMGSRECKGSEILPEKEASGELMEKALRWQRWADDITGLFRTEGVHALLEIAFPLLHGTPKPAERQ